MGRTEVIERLKAAEPALRARGVGALYLFGSYALDEGKAASDIDLLVDADGDTFYDLSNFMGAYADLQDAFPGREIGYGVRASLPTDLQARVDQDAIRIF